MLRESWDAARLVLGSSCEAFIVAGRGFTLSPTDRIAGYLSQNCL